MRANPVVVSLALAPTPRIGGRRTTQVILKHDAIYGGLRLLHYHKTLSSLILYDVKILLNLWIASVSVMCCLESHCVYVNSFTAAFRTTTREKKKNTTLLPP
jgi:hypothetical protein